MSSPPTVLHRLPVLPYQFERGIFHAYQEELKQVHTSAQLKAHVQRWRHLWRLPVLRKHGRITREELELVFGRVHKRVLKKLLLLREGRDPSRRPGRMSKLAMNIVLPRALLNAHLIAHQYQAPLDVAMIQMYAPNYGW